MERDERINGLLKKIDILSLQIEKNKEELKVIKDELHAITNNTAAETAPVNQLPYKASGSPGFENFIGLKLINFVGIIVLIAGLTIGVKYVIDINLISPLMRILSTYAAGATLFFISLRLRKKYQVFSMILFSGSMASVYFTTYAAFEYYGLIPRTPAFLLMLLFTSFTVYNSIKYNRQEIAILGLVGAYGIPFFVKGNSENVTALFTYISIINCGVLLISFKKYWLSLTSISFFTTWLIYLSWLIVYAAIDMKGTGMLFCCIFFIFFLLNTLAFKMIKRLVITAVDTFLITINTIFLYTSFLLLYKDHGHVLIENITLCFGFAYLFAAAVVKKYMASQQHLNKGLFCISLLALVAFAAMKFGGFTLTIVWVVMAVVFFISGMIFKLKLFRIAAIVLFAATLVKLLLVDSNHFNSIEKVSAYIVIGIVLLIISFLYQKYKKIIFDEK